MALDAKEKLVSNTLVDEQGDARVAAAAKAASAECEPFTDAVASEWYRRRMAGVIVKRALNQLAGLEA
mgnify:CR=1 FL=1